MEGGHRLGRLQRALRTSALLVALPLGLLPSAPPARAQLPPAAAEARVAAEAEIRALNERTVQLLSEGKYEEALQVGRMALTRSEAALGAEDGRTGTSLVNLAGALRNLRRYEEALPLLKRALQIDEKAYGREHLRTAVAVHNLARLLTMMEHHEEAVPLYERALSVFEKQLPPGHPWIGDASLGLAKTYQQLGKYDKAMLAFRRALAIQQQTLGADPSKTAITTHDLAVLLHQLGQHEEALRHFQDAFRVISARFGPESDETATILRNVAALYVSVKQYDEALSLAERAHRIDSKLPPDERRTADSQHALGSAYVGLGRYREAIPPLSAALSTRRRALGHEHIDTALTRNNLAGAYDGLGQWQDASPLYMEALATALVHARGGNAEFLAEVADNLCWRASEPMPARRVDEAIFYCKLSVNASQQIRAGAVGLDRHIRESLTVTLQGPYLALAQLLVDQGRLAEAEQALLALKEAELLEFVRRDGRAASTTPVDLTAEERTFADDLNEVAGRLAKVYRQLYADRPGMAPLGPTDRVQVEEQRDLLHQRMLAVLGSGPTPATTAAVGVQPHSRAQPLTQVTRLVRDLETSSFGGTTALVMFIPDERATTVFVYGPEGPVVLRLSVGLQELRQLAVQLRAKIQTRGAYRTEARALYSQLISPVEDHLLRQGRRPKVLMLYLTDLLRYIPFAALVDVDDRHLVQKYRIAIFTAAARDSATMVPVRGWSATAFGTTRPHGDFSALPAVEEEVNAIAGKPEGLLPGQALLDEKFSRTAWQHVMNGRAADGGAPTSVLHVATHFKVQTGDWRNSYLLLGDGGRVFVSEFDRALSARLEHVELITLSACATEMAPQGKGAEVEGLGALLLRTGARAVIGTLWPVQDEGSSSLMRAFYEARGSDRKMGKAEALQAAQRKLLEGQVKARNPQIDLRHPYYWAPFILMGNWM